MAQNVRVVLTCDIDGDGDDVSTVSFAYNGDAYSLELCANDKAELEALLDPYIGVARKETTTRTRRSRVERGRRSETPADISPSTIRDWARASGFSISERGRIPADVREAYEAARA